MKREASIQQKRDGCADCDADGPDAVPGARPTGRSFGVQTESIRYRIEREAIHQESNGSDAYADQRQSVCLARLDFVPWRRSEAQRLGQR